MFAALRGPRAPQPRVRHVLIIPPAPFALAASTPQTNIVVTTCLSLSAVEFPDSVSAAQAEALKAAFGGPTPNGSAPMAEVGAGGQAFLSLPRWLPR